MRSRWWWSKDQRRVSRDPQEVVSGDSASLGYRSIAIGRDSIGIASTGDQTTNILTWADHATVLPPEAFRPISKVDAPRNLTNLPRRPGFFVGRVGELAMLDTAMTSSSSVGVVQAMHGLGGIGKSALAAQYAAIHRLDFNPIWWITADSPAGIDAGLAAFATALQPALINVLPAEALRELAMQWFAAHTGWLVVLDNVTDVAHIRELLTRVDTGRFVITSRRATGWQGIATP